MIVKTGRRGGHTTQMFIDILASDKDAIIRCRHTLTTMSTFMDLFNKLILSIKKNEVTLIDGRSIKFMHMSNTSKLIGAVEEIKIDI